MSSSRAAPLTLELLQERTRPLALAVSRTLAVRDDLAPLFPAGGPVCGEIVQVESPALLAALLAAPTAAGDWAAVVGHPSFGLAAVAEGGGSLDRLAVVRIDDPVQAPAVLAALVDALAIVAVGPEVLLRVAVARRLAARARERGAVLVVGESWPEVTSLRLTVTAHEWVGLDQGHGHLRGCRAVVRAEGRRGAARSRSTELWLQGGPHTWPDDVGAATDDVARRDAVTAGGVVVGGGVGDSVVVGGGVVAVAGVVADGDVVTGVVAEVPPLAAVG